MSITYVDEHWEYDAPQFYDFCAGSPSLGADGSAWFEAQARMLGCRSPLAEVQKNANAGVQLGAGSQTPDAAQGPPQAQLTMKPPSSTQPPTATKSQPKNIVTSWSARGDSTKKQQDQHLSAAPTLPPKSASKRPAGPPAEEQQPEEAVETIPNIVPDGSEALDVVEELQQQDERGCTGQQADKQRMLPAKRAISTPACQAANKVQRTTRQQRARPQALSTRSATKGATPVQSSKAGVTKEPLRAAMAKARATRAAKAAAAPAKGPRVAALAALPGPPVGTAGAPAARSRAAQPMHLQGPGAASRTCATVARGGAAAGGRGQVVGTRMQAGAPGKGNAAAGGASGAVTTLEQPRRQAGTCRTGGSAAATAPAAAGPAALRTRAAHRSRRAPPGVGRAAEGASALPHGLGVARGSGVTKKLKGIGSTAAAGSGRRTDPLKLQRMLQARKVLPVRSTKPLTLPEEPALGPRRSARHSAQEPQAGNTTPFKPLVVKVQEFHTRTPARFKSKPMPAEPPRPLSMTQPKEPTLRTSLRLRASYVKSREEEELEALANMPKFHARPLNPHILEAPRTSSASKLSAKRAPVPPQPFNFITDDRLQRRHQQQQQQQQQQETFKALPLNRALLDHPVGLPKKARMSLTVPKSPALRTRSRTSAQASKQEEEMISTSFKARPVPDFLQVPREFQAPPREPPPPIQQKPFNLRTDQRGKQHQSRLQAKLSELEQEQEAMRVRKAQALPPTLEHPAVPPRPEPKPLTVPNPFKLRSEVRHEHYVAEFTSHISEEERQKQAEAEFKARAMWNGLPFRPRESEAPLTAPSEFALATEARASERQVFDQHVEEKCRAAEAEKAAAAEAARKAEEEEVRQYRRTLRFKAKPAPKYTTRKSVATSSKKPLTLPKTPQLGRKRKAADSVDK